MKNIFIEYAYDGSQFHGSQRQPGIRTVQGEIERGLKVITKENINLITAGRTDRGVHALKQISNFYTNGTIPEEKLFYALSNFLPDDIQLFVLKEVEKDFNARFDAKKRIYKYIITNDKSPFKAKYMTYVKDKIDIAKLQSIMNIFVGEHDFTNFMLTDKSCRNAEREIYSIKIKEEVKENKNIEIYIEGSSFLKSQIRLMIGGAILVLKGKISLFELKDYLNNPLLKCKKNVASAAGLYLYDIKY